MGGSDGSNVAGHGEGRSQVSDHCNLVRAFAYSYVGVGYPRALAWPLASCGRGDALGEDRSAVNSLNDLKGSLERPNANLGSWR